MSRNPSDSGGSRDSASVEPPRNVMVVSPLTGNDTPQSSGESTLQSPSAVERLRQKELLQNQLQQLKVKVSVLQSGFNSEIDTLSDDAVAQLSKKLKDELITKSSIIDSRELILRGLEMSDLTRNILNGTQEGGDSREIDRRRQLRLMLDELKTLSSKIATEQKELATKTDELEKLKMSNKDLMKRSRQLYEQLSKQKKDQENNINLVSSDTKGRQLQEDLKQKIEMNTMLRHIIQGLILGSGVDWAQDENLKQLMLDCGNTLL